jgi:hypothetical protein
LRLTRKPWTIALVFVSLAVLGVLWVLSFHNWDLKVLLPGKQGAHFSRSADSVDFSGEYKIKGPGYEGTLEITRAGDGYHAVCHVSDSVAYHGNGLAMGDVLAVVYDIQGAKYTQLAAYKKDGEGISGLIIRMNDDKLAVEKTPEAERLKASSHPLTGVYRLEGSHPNGEAYTGRMTFERTGTSYGVETWVSDSSGSYGTGFTVDDVLVTGYANSIGVGMAIYEIKPSSMDGRWLYTSYEHLPTTNDIRAGTERLRK